MRSLLHEFVHPFDQEERSAASAAWARLPESCRTADQSLGRWGAGCTATWGVMERCDFACTACYLSRGANQAPPLPLAEVRRQFETMREYLGPGGRVQVTAGEVTLLPCGELVEILRCARELQLVPMVMTHGQALLRDPRYLERLVVEGGLDRIAIHVDTTQRGRDGGDPRTERELMGVRDAMADLVRRTRKQTKRRLIAAHTVTVTRQNLPELPDIVRWTAQNADVFRMLALQPVAQVGRTREEGRPAAVWEAVCMGLGREIRPRTFTFGHQECNEFALIWLCGKSNEVVEVRRAGSRLDRWFMERWIKGGLRGWTPAGVPPLVAWARLAGRFARDPGMLFSLGFFALARLASDPRLLKRPRPFAVSVHHFMDPDRLDTPQGRERLAACAFKVPLDGRMVSMCEFNGAGLRKRRVAELAARRPHPDPEAAVRSG